MGIDNYKVLSMMQTMKGGVMNDQLCFKGGFVSEAEIIRNHYKQIGKRGGSVISDRKRAASSRNVKKALAARAVQIEQLKKAKAN